MKTKMKLSPSAGKSSSLFIEPELPYENQLPSAPTDVKQSMTSSGTNASSGTSIVMKKQSHPEILGDPVRRRAEHIVCSKTRENDTKPPLEPNATSGFLIPSPQLPNKSSAGSSALSCLDVYGNGTNSTDMALKIKATEKKSVEETSGWNLNIIEGEEMLHKPDGEKGFIEQQYLRPTRPKRALVIDDSLIIRKGIDRALTNVGLEVAQAQNGMEGFKKLKSTVFDLVLCDFLMPVMDGLDCVKQYRDWEEQHRPWFRQVSVNHKKDLCTFCHDIDKGCFPKSRNIADCPNNFVLTLSVHHRYLCSCIKQRR